ncbi:putative disease resistance RPP13-like protein 1 [Vitis vinifera]|uniref:Putative disease resistance RPP13-like protein 1 n=1 Tax=Vitis vinifera TaxID=29760 RepID=A0A438CLU9_VITVI|nr:putative disease resistance RPP13-like protein 1 [Vitis vinifera]
MAGALVGGAFSRLLFKFYLTVLNDAEVKQFTDPYVKKWLVLLKEAVYDAEDILDEIATEALRHKMEAAESQTSTSQVGNIMDMSTWVHAPFDSQSIEKRVEEIIDRLEDMARDRAALGLKEGVGEKLSQRWPSTSLVDESLVYGRDDEKQKMIEQVLSDNARRDEIGVISIVGMGGLGKTTLAQLLYNDQGTPVTGLCYKLHSKAGQREARLFVTTRSTNVAAVMRAVYSHCLGELSSEDSWSLFRKLAFENGDSSAYPQLEAIGKKIVDKCQGLRIGEREANFVMGWLRVFYKNQKAREEWKRSGIGELKELLDIKGTLRISKLQNVKCGRDAREANLKGQDVHGGVSVGLGSR